MKIIVCLKEVPSREARYEVSSDNQWIDESSVSFEINECDEYALEEALKLKEKHGGEVTLLTIGSSRAEKVMRKGLAMGADRGILVEDDDRTCQSPYAFARVLADVIAKEEFDLVLAGTQSDDLGYGQTGVMLSEFLGIPHATIVMEIDADPAANQMKVLREMESGWFQWIMLPTPSLLAIQAGISPIRYPTLKGIMQAKKKEIRKVSISDLPLDLSDAPAVEIISLYVPRQEKKAELLQGDTATVVDTLVNRLQKEAKVL